MSEKEIKSTDAKTILCQRAIALESEIDFLKSVNKPFKIQKAELIAITETLKGMRENDALANHAGKIMAMKLTGQTTEIVLE